METKLSKVRAAIVAGDWEKAFSIASKFGRLGAEKAAILRAQSAIHNPDFYRQIGYEYERIIEAGKSAMLTRFVKPREGVE